MSREIANPYVTELLVALDLRKDSARSDGDATGFVWRPSGQCSIPIRRLLTDARDRCSCLERDSHLTMLSPNLSKTWYRRGAFYLSMVSAEAPDKREFCEQTVLEGLEILRETYPRLPAYVNFEHLRDAVTLRWPKVARLVARWLLQRPGEWSPGDGAPARCSSRVEPDEVEFVGQPRRCPGDRFEPCWLVKLDERGVCSNFWRMLVEWSKTDPESCSTDLMLALLRCSEILWEQFECDSFFSPEISDAMQVVCHLPKTMLAEEGSLSVDASPCEPNALSVVTLEYTYTHWDLRQRGNRVWPVYHTKANPCKLCGDSFPDRRVDAFVTNSEGKTSSAKLALSKAKAWRRTNLRGLFFATARLCAALHRMRWWRPGGKYPAILAQEWGSLCARQKEQTQQTFD